MNYLFIYQELQALGVTANYKGYKQLALAVQLALQQEERGSTMSPKSFIGLWRAGWVAVV